MGDEPTKISSDVEFLWISAVSEEPTPGSGVEPMVSISWTCTYCHEYVTVGPDDEHLCPPLRRAARQYMLEAYMVARAAMVRMDAHE